jgi:small conductance mechanosensitive channel
MIAEILFLNFGIDISDGAIKLGNLNITKEMINTTIIKLLTLLFIIIAMYIAIKVGSHIVDKTVKKQGKHKFSLDEKKARTLGAVLKSILRYMVYFFGVGAILTQLFGSISLTFASIGGVAIGFGAQNLVKDVINGFFILFEDHFAVGEYINIDSKGGIVESIELRVTKLRDFNGDLHIIPNGLITQVTNHSRGDMRILVDLELAFDVDVDHAATVIQEACDEFKNSNENMVDGPKVLGVTALKETGVTIRVFGKAKSMTQWECENQLRR